MNSIAITRNLAGAFALVAVTATASQALAAIYTVTDRGDNTSANSKCTLREAVNIVNTGNPPTTAQKKECPPASGFGTNDVDVIKLPTAGNPGAATNFTLSSKLTIKRDVEIRGSFPGTNQTLPSIVGTTSITALEVTSNALLYGYEFQLTKSSIGLNLPGTIAKLTNVHVHTNKTGISAASYGFLEFYRGTLHDNTTTGLNLGTDGGAYIVGSSVYKNKGSSGTGIKVGTNGYLETDTVNISLNVGTSQGGGLWVGSGAYVTLRSTTLVLNGAPTGGNVYISSGGAVDLYNTVVARQTSGNNCNGSGTITSRGFSFMWATSSTPGCIVRSNTSTNGDVKNIEDPAIHETLSFDSNTPFHVPLGANSFGRPASPLLDRGGPDASWCGEPDLWNRARPRDEPQAGTPGQVRCDIGAVEGSLLQ